jgi:hypothetical protein
MLKSVRDLKSRLNDMAIAALEVRPRWAPVCALCAGTPDW